MKQTFLIILGTLLFTTANAGTVNSIGVACSQEKCRNNFQSFSVNKESLFYTNVDSYDTYTSTKIIGHIGSEESHISIVQSTLNSNTSYLVGYGTNFADSCICGLDIGLTENEKVGALIYWVKPLPFNLSTDGMSQYDGNNIVTRGNIMYNHNKISIGPEVTSIDTDYTIELKIKVNF